ncbi:MAG: sigma-54 interaction domain-containing protein [Desulfitobacteriaceae bacterium]
MKFRRSVSLKDNGYPAVLIFDRFLHLQSCSGAANRYFEDMNTQPKVLGIPVSTIPAYTVSKIIAWKGQLLILHARPLPADRGGYRVSIRPVNEVEVLHKKVKIYETILNSIHEGVLVTDPAGYVIFYNQELATLEGLDPGYALGKHITQLYRESPETSEHLRVSQTAQPLAEMYQKYFTNTGQEVHSVATTVPILEGDELLGVYSVCRDFTHIKEILTRTFELQDTKGEEKGFNLPAQEQAIAKKKTGNIRPGQGAYYTFGDIIGKSKAIQTVIEGAQRAMTSSANILIYGETGTGKELLVQSIHNGSPRGSQPFVALNCAAIPENLLETMLFGAVKGAYTGAVPTTGLFEYVGEGTLYLDEINSMSIGLQAKLLRALQERSFRKVGSVTEIALRCRIISSINVDPLTCLQEHMLREDLFYRLSVISLYLPPLRERKQDIPLLTEFFLRKHSEDYGLKKLDPELTRAFEEYRWSGNIRELENAVESMVCMSGDDKWLTREQLPMYLRQNLESAFGQKKTAEAGILQLNHSLMDTESTLIADALKKYNGNVSQAAKELGILRQSLQYRIKKLGMEIEKYRR